MFDNIHAHIIYIVFPETRYEVWGWIFRFFVCYLKIDSPEPHQTYLLFADGAHSGVSHLLIVSEVTHLHC